MRLFSSGRKKIEEPQICTASQRVTSLRTSLSGDCRVQYRLYRGLRESVPVIDAAISKLIRLIGDFELKGADETHTTVLRDFCDNVRVGASGTGLRQFIYSYLDQLLTYGIAVGEIVPTLSGRDIAAVCNAPLDAVELREGDSPLDVRIYSCASFTPQPVAHPELIVYTLLNPEPGKLCGNSILRGLPFVSDLLIKIFDSIGQNFERAGNLRFAVTYNPPAGASQLSSKQRVDEIAREWGRAMREGGRVCDFVSVGDVSIKAIGADNQVLDCDVPIRHVLEQIVAKLSIPPFLLGLSWSTTERMSAQQADILTSELEYYRGLLTPVIRWVCAGYMERIGLDPHTEVEWNNISLQDETELASARLDNARAAQLEAGLTEVKA